MVKLENIIYRYDEKFTLNIKELSLGEAFTTNYIVGASGSGKSTLLKIICGLKTPHKGCVEVDGKSMSDLISTHKLHTLKMIYMSQELGLWSHMSCIEHIRFMLPKSKHATALLWLEKVQLLEKADAKPDELSGGQKQRLALARALCIEPRFLVLDEPFASLDIVLADELQQIISKEQKIHKFQLLQVSHNTLGFYDKNVNIIVMDKGEVVQSATFTQIINNPVGRWSKKWIELLSKKG